MVKSWLLSLNVCNMGKVLRSLDHMGEENGLEIGRKNLSFVHLSLYFSHSFIHSFIPLSLLLLLLQLVLLHDKKDLFQNREL